MAAANNNKDMSAARRGAALKREKAASAKVARAAGKLAAAARRSEDNSVRHCARAAIAEEAAFIDQQIAASRCALGLGDNDPNPVSICLMIEALTAQMRIRLSQKGFW